MLTLKSTLKDLIDLCTVRGACEKAMLWMNKELEKDKSITLDRLLAIYVNDKDAPEGWAAWNLRTNGKDLDEDCRKFFINKIKDSNAAIQLHINCDYLTDREDTLLESKFKVNGKNIFPTIEKELATGIVTRAKAVKL